MKKITNLIAVRYRSYQETPWYLEQNALVFDLKRLHVFLKRLDVF